MKEIDSSTDREADRTQLQEKIRELEAEVIQAKESTTGDAAGDVGAAYAIKLREAEQELEESSAKWRQERRRLNEENEDLEVALRKARTEGRAADVQEAEVTARIREVEVSAEQRVQEASGQWTAERERLQHSVEDMKQSLVRQESKIDRAELDAIREELLTRVAETEDEKGRIDEELTAARAQWEEERATLQSRTEEAEHRTRTERENIESTLRDELTTEYEWKLKELTFQKEQLEQKLKESSAASSAPAGANDAPSPSDKAAEIARADEQIVEITAFIDDPSSSLSKVVRKNVERSEWEAYRRGLSYNPAQTPDE